MASYWVIGIKTVKFRHSKKDTNRIKASKRFLKDRGYKVTVKKSK